MPRDGELGEELIVYMVNHPNYVVKKYISATSNTYILVKEVS